MGRIIPTGKLVAPKRARLWGPGDNPGDYGSNVLTDEAAARVMAEYNRAGRALAIDYQHATNLDVNPDYDPANPPPMAGYAELKVITTAAGPEIWIDPVRWSDCGRPFAVPGEICCGKHQIETGQRGYISPDWQRTKDTNEPIAINRLALVAEPGTYGINMLASRASGNTRALTMSDMEILKALLAAAMAAVSSADPDIQGLGQAVADQTSALATGKGLDLSSAAALPPPPASEDPAALAARAAKEAADCAAKAAADQAKTDEMAGKVASAAATAAKVAIEAAMARGTAARAAAGSVVAAKPGVTAEEVQRMVSEDGERRELLAANKDVLGEFVPLLASKSLSDVKAFVAVAKTRAASITAAAAQQQDQGARGAPITGAAIVSPADKAEVAAVARKMGCSVEKTEAVIASGGTLVVSLEDKYRAKSARANG